MCPSFEAISESLHVVFMSTIGKGSEEDKFNRFIRGHVPELDFVTEYQGEGNILDSGKFMYSRDENQLQTAIYCTVTSQEINSYIDLYKLIFEKLKYLKALFIVQILDNSEGDLESHEVPVRSEWHKLQGQELKKIWRETLRCGPSRKKYGNRNQGYPKIEEMKMQLVENSNISFKGTDSKELKFDVLKPEYKVFRFEQGSFVESEVVEIRANFNQTNSIIQQFRPFGIVREFYSHLEDNVFWKHYAGEFFNRILLRGLDCEISDFDCIIDDGGGKFSFIEIKQKDPDGKTNNTTGIVEENENNWTLGIEMRRLLWWLKICDNIGEEHRFYYVIRELDNLTNRDPIGWKYATFHYFRNQIIVGSERNAACMAPYGIFSNYNGSFPHLTLDSAFSRCWRKAKSWFGL